MAPENCNIWRSWTLQLYLAIAALDETAIAKWKDKRAKHMRWCPLCQKAPEEPAEHDYSELDQLEEP